VYVLASFPSHVRVVHAGCAVGEVKRGMESLVSQPRPGGVRSLVGDPACVDARQCPNVNTVLKTVPVQPPGPSARRLDPASPPDPARPDCPERPPHAHLPRAYGIARVTQTAAVSPTFGVVLVPVVGRRARDAAMSRPTTPRCSGLDNALATVPRKHRRPGVELLPASGEQPAPGHWTRAASACATRGATDARGRERPNAPVRMPIGGFWRSSQQRG
jgi:hypothetical protein